MSKTYSSNGISRKKSGAFPAISSGIGAARSE